MWWSADRNNNKKLAQPRFSPISGPFWVRVGIRVRVRVGVGVRARGWVGSTPVPLPATSKCFRLTNANSPPPQRYERTTCEVSSVKIPEQTNPTDQFDVGGFQLYWRFVERKRSTGPR